MKKLVCILLLITIATKATCVENIESDSGDGAKDDSNKEYEDDQPSSGERFVAVHVNKAGAAEELKPTLVGLTNMAISFLPQDYTLINVISATREVLAGIRYSLLVNAKDAHDTDIICYIVVLEKPWVIVNQYGEKLRNLQHTNCTSDKYNAAENNRDQDFNFNPIMEDRSNKSISDDSIKQLELQIITEKVRTTTVPNSPIHDNFLAELEQQIIKDNKAPQFNQISKMDAIGADVSTINLDIPTTEKLIHVDNNPEYSERSNIDSMSTTNRDSVFEPTNDEDNNLHTSTTGINALPFNSITESEIVPTISSIEKQTSSNLDFGTETTDAVVTRDIIEGVDTNSNNIDKIRHENNEVFTAHDDTQKIVQITEEPTNNRIFAPVIVLDSHLLDMQTSDQPLPSNDATLFDRVILLRQKREFDTEKDFQMNLIDQALEQLDHIDSDDNKRVAIDVLQVKKVEDEKKVLYKVKVKTGDSHCTEESIDDANCRTNLVKGSKKICYIEIRVIKRDAVQVAKSECIPEKRLKREELVGAPISTQPDDKDVQNLIHEALATLSGQSYGETYSLSSIDSVTTQVVAGITYKIKGKFSSKNNVDKECTMEIWSRSWLRLNLVTMTCGEDKPYEFEVRTNGNEINRVRRQVPGSPKQIAIDRPDVTQRVQDALEAIVGSDSNAQFSLSRIINATEKVVAGKLYTIQAEFDLPTGANKVLCVIEIWSRPWLNTNNVTMTCDGTTEPYISAYRQKRSLLYNHRDENTAKTNSQIVEENLFNNFVRTFKRNYRNSLESDMRFRIFKSNLFKIEQLNAYEQGTAKYGITEFADMTSAEYFQRTGLLPQNSSLSNEIKNSMATIPDIPLPRDFDWRDKNAISPVKNQGNCGSCWAFSVTGNIEGLHAIKTGKMEEYSEQELVDCDTVDNGCNGGLPDNAYKAIEQLGGLELESEYPYSAKAGQCHFNKTMSHVKVTGAVDLPKNETAMAQWLIENGPLSIGINANAMQFYHGGVSHPWRPLCLHSSIDHGVLIVGFGISEYPLFNKTLPYWIVKNSWGPQWGEQGYYRVYRGDNTCGLNSMVSSAVLE